MIILIDKNEVSSSPKTYQQIKRSFSDVIEVNLPHRVHGNTSVTSGDINIPLDDGSLLAIERKTPEDFLNSISSGHIFDQVEVMAANARYSVIIVTGSFTYGKVDDMCYVRNEDGDKQTATNWRGSSVRSVIATIQYSGCPVIFCPPSAYCQMISEQYTLVNKGVDERRKVKKNRIITFPPVDERVEFLAQLPGISLTLAERLLSFAGMMDNNADEDGFGTVSGALHWLSIMSQIDKDTRPQGLGPNKILTLRKFLGLENNQYIAIPKEVTITKKDKSIILTEMNGQQYKKLGKEDK